MITDTLSRIDHHPAMGRARTVAHGLGRRVAFVVDSACIAFTILTGLTFSLAGFDLETAARLWGGFWTHYADATPEARLPVLITMTAVWFAVTVLTALVRATGKRASSAARDLRHD
jgi:hypothetical protein